MNAPANLVLAEGRCALCKRFRGDHKAYSLHCPIGRKHRTHGFGGFHREQTYTPKNALGQSKS